MSDVATFSVMRRPDLATWRAGPNGRYLVRNRRTGESFELGEEEHLLLSLLDGLHGGGEICTAFAHEFGQPLSPAELDEFAVLATERGLLEKTNGTSSGEITSPGRLAGSWSAPAPPAASLTWGSRSAVRLWNLGSTGLEWIAWPLNAGVARIQRRVRKLKYVGRTDDVFIVAYADHLGNSGIWPS